MTNPETTEDTLADLLMIGRVLTIEELSRLEREGMSAPLRALVKLTENLLWEMDRLRYADEVAIRHEGDVDEADWRRAREVAAASCESARLAWLHGLMLADLKAGKA